MEQSTKYKIRAFMWDQFVRPIILLFNFYQLKGLALALLILSIVAIKSRLLFWATAIILIIISFYEIYLYYKSGEYLKNYREYKYPEYKQITKILKREKKSLNTLKTLQSYNTDNTYNEEENRLQGLQPGAHSSKAKDEGEVRGIDDTTDATREQENKP